MELFEKTEWGCKLEDVFSTSKWDGSSVGSSIALLMRGSRVRVPAIPLLSGEDMQINHLSRPVGKRGGRGKTVGGDGRRCEDHTCG